MPPMQVLYTRTQTTLADLSKFIGKTPFTLYAEATRAQLLPAGPQYWFYYGADGKPDTVFTLEIVLPVSGRPIREFSDTSFQIKKTEPFKYIAAIHEGDWAQLHVTYAKIFNEIFSKGYKPLTPNECREMYTNVDFDNKDNNVTEVRIGIE